MTEKNVTIMKLLEQYEEEYDEKDELHHKNGNERFSDMAMLRAHVCRRLRAQFRKSEDADVFKLLDIMDKEYIDMINKDRYLGRGRDSLKRHIECLRSCTIIRNKLKRSLKIKKMKP